MGEYRREKQKQHLKFLKINSIQIFVEKIKSLFESSEFIKVTVSDEIDETEYLLVSEQNAKVLAESLSEYKAGKFVPIENSELDK